MLSALGDSPSIRGALVHADPTEWLHATGLAVRVLSVQGGAGEAMACRTWIAKTATQSSVCGFLHFNGCQGCIVL